MSMHGAAWHAGPINPLKASAKLFVHSTLSLNRMDGLEHWITLPLLPLEFPQTKESLTNLLWDDSLVLLLFTHVHCIPHGIEENCLPHLALIYSTTVSWWYCTSSSTARPYRFFRHKIAVLGTRREKKTSATT